LIRVFVTPVEKECNRRRKGGAKFRDIVSTKKEIGPEGVPPAGSEWRASKNKGENR